MKQFAKANTGLRVQSGFCLNVFTISFVRNKVEETVFVGRDIRKPMKHKSFETNNGAERERA